MDSETKIILERVVDALHTTDMKMWWLTFANVIVVGVFSCLLWRTNKNQLKMTLRKEYRDLHLLLLQINNLSDTILDDVMVGIGACKIDVLTDKITSIMETIDSINGMNIHTLLPEQSVDKFNKIRLSLMFVQAGCIHLQRAIIENDTKYELPVNLLNADVKEKVFGIKEALSFYLNENKIMSDGLFLDNLIQFISLCNKHKLYKATEKYCNIYNLTK